MNKIPLGLLEASEPYEKFARALKILKEYLPTMLNLTIDEDQEKNVHFCIFCGEFFPLDKEIIHDPKCPGQDLINGLV